MKDKTKRFESAKELYAHFHQVKEEAKELPDIIKEQREKVETLINLNFPWSNWYAIPFKNSLSIFLVSSGLEEILIQASNHEDPAKVILEILNTNPDPLDDDSLSDKEKSYFISLFMNVMHQMASFSIFSESMSELVEKASHDDESLFNAVIVDRSVVACPAITKRIQIAELEHDESFMNKLAKAITKTRPRRPNSEYDDLRYMLLALDEMKEYQTYSVKQKFDLLVDDMELMDVEGKKDAFEAFKKIERRARERRGI